MPRVYKRIRLRAHWSQEDLAEAIDGLKNKTVDLLTVC
jgi:DNA-binding XRE family transcriptional regulator